MFLNIKSCPLTKPPATISRRFNGLLGRCQLRAWRIHVRRDSETRNSGTILQSSSGLLHLDLCLTITNIHA
jgi:hypothetical protein